MKKLKAISLFLILSINTKSNAQIIDGEFLTNINGNMYNITVAINLQSKSGTAGIIQIEFTYNSTSLYVPSSPVKNIDYTLHNNFDLYFTQNVTKPDTNSIRISLLTFGTPPPVPIDTSQTLIITYNFTITNPQGTSNLEWTRTDIAPEFLQQNYQVGNWPNLDESLSNVTVVAKDNLNSDEYMLYQNFPNPFNPFTLIKYHIPINGYVSLIIYDMLGNEIAVLVDGNKYAGDYQVEFNANKLPSGIYIYRLESNEFVQVKKLLILK